MLRIARPDPCERVDQGAHTSTQYQHERYMANLIKLRSREIIRGHFTKILDTHMLF